MKRFVWSLVIVSALSLVYVPEASPHGSEYRGHDRHTIVRHGHSYPYGLHRNYDFHRWYWRSHHRYDIQMSWDRLFDIYRYERKYRRPSYYYDRRGYYRQRKQHRRH